MFVADLTALDNPTLLIQDGTEPVWSPDGSKIAFTRSDQDFVDTSGSPTARAGI